MLIEHNKFVTHTLRVEDSDMETIVPFMDRHIEEIHLFDCTNTHMIFDERIMSGSVLRHLELMPATVVEGALDELLGTEIEVYVQDSGVFHAGYAFLRETTTLEVLELYHLALDNATYRDMMRDLSQNTSLYKLVLQNVGIENPLPLAHMLIQHPNIREVDLTGNHIRNVDPLIQALDMNPAIHRITLEDNPVHEADITHVPEITLERLPIRRSRVFY